MKITYLGTAAAEGFPAVFCNCQYCKEARKLCGRNIRTRSQSLINDDLLIDLPADTYHHFLQNGIEGDRIRYLLVTHPHQDHFYPSELAMRHSPFAHEMRAPVLDIYCSEGTWKTVQDQTDTFFNTSFTTVQPFQRVSFGAYTVTALPARHMTDGSALNYIIQADKTLLYAHDTGYLKEEVFAYIEKEQLHFDLISLDCTNVDIPVPDTGHHMGFPNIERVLNRLSQMGAVSDATVKVVNHFSHNGNPLQSVLEARASEYDCIVSYDGRTVEF